MDQNTQNNSTKLLTFVDVIRMFKVKTVVIIICFSLIAAVIGGAAPLISSSMSTTYESKITFYLSTKDGTNALLPLLNSDSFAEKLLLEENGLPKKEECNEADYNAALAAVKAHNDALSEKRACAKEAEILAAQVAEKKAKYDSDDLKCLSILDIFKTYLNAYSTAIENGAATNDPAVTDLLAKSNEYQEKLDNANDKKAASKAAYDEINDKKLANDVKLAKAKENVIRTRTEMERALEVVLAPWREKNETAREQVAVIRESVSFEYAKLNDAATGSAVDNQNAAFLIITVSVKDDAEMAKFINDQIILLAPDYVEKNIERITYTNDPSCTLISTFAETQEAVEGKLWLDAVIYGAVAGGAVLAISCFTVVIYNLLPDDMKRKKKADK